MQSFGKLISMQKQPHAAHQLLIAAIDVGRATFTLCVMAMHGSWRGRSRIPTKGSSETVAAAARFARRSL